jgi:hypothetical protein
MLPPGQHVQAAERLADPRTGLIAEDGTEKETLPRTRPTRGAAASIAGRTSELLCSGASGW